MLKRAMLVLLAGALLFATACNNNLPEDEPDVEVSSPSTVEFERVVLNYSEEWYPTVVTWIWNNTDMVIETLSYGMLAFDMDGNPLEIYWNAFDGDDANPTYYYLYDWETGMNIQPGETCEQNGWVLFSEAEGAQEEIEKIQYIFYEIQDITFEGGDVWQNPRFNAWREACEGQKMDLYTLNSYYPNVVLIDGK